MTGTAATEAEEFFEIYRLGVVEVPTNMPVIREDHDDQVFRTAREKYAAIVEEIDARARGRPADPRRHHLDREVRDPVGDAQGRPSVPHNVLNARYHEQEAKIVADAGVPGAVTIATNMAGRGTDIQLGGNVEMRVIEALEAAEKEGEHGRPGRDAAPRSRPRSPRRKARVIAAGGLYVLATERHESRRIDNQLRGRSGRQGDPGRTNFYLSLEDDLMRIFGSDRLDSMLGKLGMKEGEAIVHPWVNKALEKAQGKVEARNFDIRKNLLKYDDVMNDQRKAIFSQRREIMEADDLVRRRRATCATRSSRTWSPSTCPPRAYADQWDIEGLDRRGRARPSALDLPLAAWADEEGVDDEDDPRAADRRGRRGDGRQGRALRRRDDARRSRSRSCSRPSTATGASIW